MAGQGEQLGVVAHEQAGQRIGQRHGQRRQRHAGDAHQQDALAQQIFQLPVVLRAVVIADHRRAADGVADVDGDEDELDVHQHAVGGDAVLAGQPQQLEVVDHAHQR